MENLYSEDEQIDFCCTENDFIHYFLKKALHCTDGDLGSLM